MGKIFCLMGKSSSGKDTIFKKIRESDELGLTPVIPYTTRPKRVGETDGIEYYFITEERLSEYRDETKIIEQRVYETINGKWYYCTVDDGQINLDQGNYVLIVTLEAYVSLKGYFGEEAVIPIYIDIDDGERLQRALNREKQETKPNYNELCRRFLADNIDFSEERLKNGGITKYYINNDLEECIKEIIECIKSIKEKDR